MKYMHVNYNVDSYFTLKSEKENGFIYCKWNLWVYCEEYDQENAFAWVI